MRRDLLSRLADAGVTLFWTVLVGKELRRRDLTPPRGDYRWVSASASYALKSDRVEQIGASARRLRPGPEMERHLEWVTRHAEA